VPEPQQPPLNLEDVENLLKKCELPQYFVIFQKERIDLDTLGTLTHDELKDLGVTSLGDRKRIMNAAQQALKDKKPQEVKQEEEEEEEEDTSDELKIIGRIGGGSFGEVFKGKYRGEFVAAKRLMSQQNDKLDTTFYQELDTMMQLKHKNVVKFMGIVFKDADRYVLTELMDKGSAKSFLSSSSKLEMKPSQIVGIAIDTAAGMAYLSSQKIIHRDLAARNLLVASKNGLITKVTDFGLSRKAANDEQIYEKSGNTNDPIKWAAPETFEGKVSLLSDIWSFGITLYELFIFCVADPYVNLSNAKVKHLLKDKSNMAALLTLDDAPEEIQSIISDCLQYEPSIRPSFGTIGVRLRKIQKQIEADSLTNQWKNSDPISASATQFGEGSYDDGEDGYDENALAE